MEQNVKDDERKEMLEKTNETINGSNTFLSRIRNNCQLFSRFDSLAEVFKLVAANSSKSNYMWSIFR